MDAVQRLSGDRAPGALWWLITGVGCLLLLTVAVPLSSAVYDVPLLVAFMAATTQCAALPVALVRPAVATLMQGAAITALALGGPVVDDVLWPVPVTGIVALCAHTAVLGLREGWRTAAAAWWFSVLLVLSLVVLDPNGRGVEVAGNSLIATTGSSVLVLVGTIAYRQRLLVRRQLLDARRDVELEQSRRALAEERTRIARELHDVVAHSMSVMHMQASTARFRLPQIGPEALDELDQIASTARVAMKEMRQILSVLRDADGAVLKAPAPQLAQLHELAEAAARAGTPTDVHLSPAAAAASLPGSVEVTAYRIAQEALSNVVRHAPGAQTTIDVDLDDAGALVVSVVNSPPTGALQPGGDVEDPGHTRAHLGLVGMRERVELVGGDLVHGPLPGGGFSVLAHLPAAGNVRARADQAGSRP